MKNWIKATTIVSAIAVFGCCAIYFDFIAQAFFGFAMLVLVVAFTMIIKEVFDAWDKERGKRR